MSASRRIVPADDPDALARLAAERLVHRISANPGQIAICLSGGSAPARLYELLPGERYRSQIPWSRVHWFVGDERFVPAADPRNNMSSACRLFLNACAPVANVHPIPTDAASPEESARCYEHELQAFYGADVLDPARPLFDLALMGVGPDGHTASLFPGDAAVDERERWVVGVPVAPVEPLVARVTLTLPALGSCREMLFLISGAAKRPILTRLLANENLPANRARSAGETVWLVDRAALPEDFRG